MKICIVINSLTGGGAERVVCNLANYLIKNENQVTIILLTKSKTLYGIDAAVELIHVDNSNAKNKVKLYQALRKTISSIREADCYLGFLPIPIILLLLLKNKLNAKLICAERNDPTKYSPIIRVLLKNLSHRADAFVFQTETVREWYGRSVKECRLIPNAISQQILDSASTERKRKKEIVAVGRLTKQKNYPLLLKAFARVHRVHDEYTLHIFGSGELRQELVQLCSELDITDSVVFEGFVQNIADRICEAEIYVLSSDFEGMPNALIESMTLGLACVSTDCGGGGARYLVKDGENGILVPTNDPDAMTDAINYLIENPAVSAAISKNAMDIRNKLSPETIHGEWTNYIQRIISE